MIVLSDSSVSVIIPCFNSEEYIALAVESVLRQSFKNVELIVVDDGSRDQTINILENYSGCLKLLHSNRNGAAFARNLGWRSASGGYIKFLDSDDLLEEKCIEEQVLHASQFPLNTRTQVIGSAVIIDAEGKIIGRQPQRDRYKFENPLAFILSNNFLTSTPLHRYEFLDEVGGFDPSLPNGQEYDLHARMVMHGLEFRYRDIATYRYRLHSASGQISSGGPTRYGAMAKYNFLENLLDIACRICPSFVDSSARRAFGQQFFYFGRKLVLAGFVREASVYFQRARKLGVRDLRSSIQLFFARVAVFRELYRLMVGENDAIEHPIHANIPAPPTNTN